MTASCRCCGPTRHPHRRHGRRLRRGRGRPARRPGARRPATATRYRLVGAGRPRLHHGARTAPRASRASPILGCAGAAEYAAYLRTAAEREPRALRRRPLRRAAAAQPRPHRLHARRASGRRWRRCARPASLTRSGVAPGPANGFTLDVIACVERFGSLIDWAMLILNPFEPWPGSLALPACERARRAGARPRGRLRRRLPRRRARRGQRWRRRDHRSFRPAGWVGAARAKLDAMRPIAERHGADAAPAGVPVDARAAGRGLRRPDADPGAGPGRQADRARSARSWPACPPGGYWTTTSWPGSPPWATTRAACG